MQLDAVAVDIGELHAELGQRLSPPALRPSPGRTAGAHRMKRRGIEPHADLARLCRAENRREAAEHIFQYRHIFFHMRLELHAEFGQRSAGDHGDSFRHAGLNHARALHHGVHRPGAERFDIAPRGIAATDVFGDRLGEIAAAAIVTVAHRFFRTADDEIDVIGLERQVELTPGATHGPRKPCRTNFPASTSAARLASSSWAASKAPTS